MCEHNDFESHVVISRLEDCGRFAADVTIRCKECNVPFKFLGLPWGVSLEGAAVSVDGTEARLAIAPQGEALPTLSGPMGFGVSFSKSRS